MYKKKILIVNNNMHIGGVQKSLYNLLWNLHDKYEITLYLFSDTGVYMDGIPKDVQLCTAGNWLRFLGISQNQCVSRKEKLLRGLLAGLCRVMGRAAIMKLLLAFTKPLPDRYDCAIAFLHNGRKHAFYGGVQEVVLEKVQAVKKVAFLHCDYRSCGADYRQNNSLIAKFHRIAACSDGCRQAFLDVLPELEEKCITVRNFHRVDEILSLADEMPVDYDKNSRQVVMVSRLSHEKGIDRAIRAAAEVLSQGIPMQLHIVGGGPMKDALKALAQQLNITQWVHFYAEQANPYRFLKNADLFLMTSYHEAAPMVIEEAACIGIPVMTARTTSSDEMVTARQIGWVCDNDDRAICDLLVSVLRNSDALAAKKRRMQAERMDNALALKQFEQLIEE